MLKEEKILKDSNIKELFESFDHKEVNIPSGTTKVYKDECMLSYHTPRSEGGLFICLKNFLAFSSVYLHRYHEATGNKYFLNLKEVLRQDEDGKASKTTTIEFGDEKVEIETDADESYEQLVTIVVYSNNIKHIVPFPQKELPNKLEQSVRALLSSQSEEKKNALLKIKEELVVSKHSETLKQVKKVSVARSGWKCAKCDLTTNLWMNLSDGFIGCGRKFYDGSGGNNHAVLHYEETKFPLAVKLGTITPKGADVFSYDEKKMIIDTKLDEHLKFFGIDMAMMKKTDKSMEELSLDASLKNEVGSVLEKGKNLRTVFGPGFTGIRNIGSTCYLGALMQTLMSVEEFKKKYYDPKMESAFDMMKRGAVDLSENLDVQMVKLCNGLYSGDYSKPSERRRKFLARQRERLRKLEKKEEDMMQVEEPEPTDEEVGQDGIPPNSFKSLIGKGHSEFSTFRQQDPHELLGHLVSLVERNEMVKEEDDEIGDPFHLFKFFLEEKIKCQTSGFVKLKKTLEHCLSLPIRPELAKNHKDYLEYQKIQKIQDEEDSVDEQARQIYLAKKKTMKEQGADTTELDKEEDLRREKVKERNKKRPSVVRPEIYMQNILKGFSFVDYINDFYSAAIKGKSVAKRSVAIKTFPKYLICRIEKYYFTDKWVPKKLDVKILKPQTIDLSPYKSTGLLEGEKEMVEEEKKKEEEKDDDDEKKLPYNVDLVGTIFSSGMGFTENACKRACIATNNTTTEAAINWILTNIGNPQLNAPLDEDQVPGKSKGPSDEEIIMLVSMGIPKDAAIHCLKKTDNNPQRAVDYYFSHLGTIEQDMILEATKVKKVPKKKKKKRKVEDSKNGTYELFGFISHLGGNVQSGHYVCHLKKNGKWYLFNDETVKESKETPFDRGYLYFYKRK